MNILVLTAHYPPYHQGGYELRCQNVLMSLQMKGHNICVMSNRLHTQIHHVQINGIETKRILHLESASNVVQLLWRDFQDLSFLKAYIDKFNPDVIYLWHTINLTRAIFPFLARHNIPIVYDEGGMGLAWAWTKHGNWFNFMERNSSVAWKQWVKQQFGTAINILSREIILQRWQWPTQMIPYFNSIASLEYAKQAGVPTENARVIYSGIDTEAFSFSTNRKIDQKIRLIIPGRIVPTKGVKDSITLLASLIDSGVDAQLSIVGPEISSSYVEEIKSEIKRNKLEAFVQFDGSKKHLDLVKCYHESEICLLLSYQKFGLSRVPLEAMATGSLIISYGNEGSSEIINSGETGYLVSEGDTDAIVKIIHTLISNSEKYRQIIVNAHDYVHKNHVQGAYVNQVEALLYEATQNDTV